ncbi:MAG: hypothetical protein H7144_10075 [Burkholderiales bacterium]|nr:hypothetical protein [Phycisphaerae bacterium]
MAFLMTRLINLGWYWLIGYRIGDTDGTDKLVHALRWIRARLQGRKAVQRPVLPPPLPVLKRPANPNKE